MKEIIKNEIDKRMCDNNWDHEIASQVIGKRKKQHRLYASIGSSLALVVFMISGIILFSGNQSAAVYKYDSFISRQINGTYNSVFKKQEQKVTTKKVVLFSNEIDSMIDETLAQR